LKILIVDDDSLRVRRIVNYLKENNIPDENITIRECTDHAKQLLLINYYDLLILDVVLPKRLKESPSAQLGLDFLSHITKSTKYKKPEKIIGITAHIEDISKFKERFNEFCFSILEASQSDGKWLTQLKYAIDYAHSSKIARVHDKKNIHVLTMHGILTFGEWQIRLPRLISQTYEGIKTNSYKYGFYSFFFLIPYFRNKQTEHLTKHLIKLFETNQNDQFIIYSHSFGTYLIAHALKNIVGKGLVPPVSVLVLSGSILKSNFDWDFLKQTSNPKIVNDCTSQDWALIASEALILGTGMAGRTGFFGFQNEKFVNRFFDGGHSSFFKGDDFMRKYWIPLLDIDQEVYEVDVRSPSIIENGVIEYIASIFGFFKSYIYLLLVIVLSVTLIKKILI
jgi:CheY-like chemotaxis protein